MSEVPSTCPWLPDQLFAEQNEVTINTILDRIGFDFSSSGALDIPRVADGQIPQETMDWMWDRLMGRQHGSTEGWGDKIQITPALESRYRSLAVGLRYGDFSFFRPSKVADKSFDVALIPGGMPHEDVSRLLAAINNDPENDAAREVVLLAGQRLRWNTPTESDEAAIYQAVASMHPDTNIARLRELSPWLQEQEAMATRDVWSMPFATEYEMARLCVEAVFMNQIDWSDYPVTPTMDPDAKAQGYEFEGQHLEVPARNEALTTYELKDGRKVHVLNGKAVARARGVPRPTADSQAQEVFDWVSLPDQASVLVSTSLPHVRAGLDIVTRSLVVAGDKIASTDITTPGWMADKELITALGEIPATHKADLRLRAVLAGGNPDAPELVAL